MNNSIKLFILIFIIGFTTVAFAQSTIVSGTVADASTNEPLPFVNVIFKGTRSGGTTDINGKYTISTTEKCDSISVSYIGYNSYTKAIQRGKTQEINILLTQGVELKAIEITAGENPAHRILRQIIANKPANNIEKLEAYEYEVYNKVQVDLNNIDEEYKNKAVFKPFAFIFDNIDSTQANEKPHLPVFITETLSDYYFRKNPTTHNEVIKASKVSGLKNESMSQFMGDMYQKVNFYDNNIFFFQKQIASPLSSNALYYYKFYLIDSVEIDGHRCYQLMFKPKRKQELAFEGNVWVTDSTFAIKQIEAKIAEDANINFLNSASMIQSFTLVDGSWMVEKEKLIIDFNPFPVEGKRKTLMGFYARKTASYKNFKINKPKEDSFYSLKENLKVETDAVDKSASFWQENRHDTLSKSEVQIYKMVDTIQSLKAYRNWVEIIQLVATGYKVMGPVELGPISNIYSYNTIEGNRLRFGMRTSNAFSKTIELNGHVAYGLKDEEFKYRVGYRLFLEKKHRTMLSMHYKNDNAILGLSQRYFASESVLTSVFQFDSLRSLTREKQFKASLSRDWFKGLSTTVSFYNTEMIPQGNYKYILNDTTPTGDATFKNNITTSELRFMARFAYKEQFIDGVFERKSLGTTFPILQAQLTLGMKGVLGGEYDYQKLAINLSDRFNINPFGKMEIEIEGGKIWGAVPFPLLNLPGGNETFFYYKYSFNGMNYFEFINDMYVSASVLHHFNGFFLNRIPLMRQLKWREVVGIKGIMGSLDAKHNTVMQMPDYVQPLTTKPYYEATIGIENIFKILRIDGIWRMSYLDLPNASPFLVKASLQFVF